MNYIKFINIAFLIVAGIVISGAGCCCKKDSCNVSPKVEEKVVALEEVVEQSSKNDKSVVESNNAEVEEDYVK
jgi:hypothetical protein